MIHVVELSKNYGPVRALDRVSFDVPEGRVVGFLGPNGAGKSTALRILTGFLPGDRGTVQVAGYDVHREPIAVRRAIGYLPEGVPLYPEMRVTEFLRFRARLKGIARRERRAEIDRVLERAGIESVRKRLVGNLSKGYRQRVGLADALLGGPRVLILVEPTVGLDPEQVIQFRHLLRDVGADRTVFLSTHILSEVEIVCDDAIIIYGGRIAAHDSAANLRSRVQAVSPVLVEIAGPQAAVRAALAALPQVDRVSGGAGAVGEGEQGEGEQPARDRAAAQAGAAAAIGYHTFRLSPRRDQDPRQAVFELVRAQGWSLRELHREPVTLEEAFLEIIGAEEEKRGRRGAAAGTVRDGAREPMAAGRTDS
jgi:ABC-2 type transport system ATP-binding protein